MDWKGVVGQIAGLLGVESGPRNRADEEEGDSAKARSSVVTNESRGGGNRCLLVGGTNESRGKKTTGPLWEDDLFRGQRCSADKKKHVLVDTHHHGPWQHLFDVDTAIYCCPPASSSFLSNHPSFHSSLFWSCTQTRTIIFIRFVQKIASRLGAGPAPRRKTLFFVLCKKFPRSTYCKTSRPPVSFPSLLPVREGSARFVVTGK